MSTKTNDPKQTAPETEPVVDDIKTEPVTPDDILLLREIRDSLAKDKLSSS